MRVTLEESVDLVFEDESDGDDLDDIFTQEELEEEAEEADVDSWDKDDDSAGTFRSSSSGAPASRQSSEIALRILLPSAPNEVSDSSSVSRMHWTPTSLIELRFRELRLPRLSLQTFGRERRRTSRRSSG